MPSLRHPLSAAALAAAAVLLALLFGFLGRIHLAFDAFAHFRLHLAALLALLGLLLALRTGWRIAGGAAMAIAAAAVAATLGPANLTGPAIAKARGGTGTADAHYRLMQLNLRYDNPEPGKVLLLIGRVAPDVVTLDEVPKRWQEKLALTEALYPYRIICPPPSYIGGVAILSRRPFSASAKPRCHDRGSMATAMVEFGGRPVEIVALHLGWPWPFDQPTQLPVLEPVLRTTARNTILAGDFNAAPWSETARRVAEAGGMKIVRGIGPTWLLNSLPDALRRLIGLPIDNILVKGAIVPAPPTRLGDAGSDHLPVLLEFGLKPKAEPKAPMQARLGE